MAVALLLLGAGCTQLLDGPDDGSGSDGTSSNGGSNASGGGGTGPDLFAEARDACVDRINAFRATENLPALARWTAAEACTDRQSGLDADTGSAHGNFGTCDEWAQNTCPGWPDVDSVIEGCLQLMWDEGPGEPFSEHGHYINMSSTNYTRVACGFYVMDNGEIWSNHNFQ